MSLHGVGDDAGDGDIDGGGDSGGDVGSDDGPDAGDDEPDWADADWPAATWRRVDEAPSAPWPPKTYAGAAVFDPQTKTILMYGGGVAFGSARSDMWALDGEAWTQLCTDCAPGPRLGHAMVYDEKHERVLMFGGSTGASYDSSGTLARQQALNDLWAYADGTWSELHPANAPTPRWLFAYGYDVQRQVLVVFGGATPGAPATDVLHEFDGANWLVRAVPAGAPATRVYASGAYSRALGGVVVHGGNTDYVAGSYFDDLSLWNGSDWVFGCLACTGDGRVGAGLLEVPPGGALQILAGFNGSDLAGTWTIDVGSSELTATSPSGRDTFWVVFDPEHSRIVLFGGNGGGCGDGDSGDCDELWVLEPPE